MSSTARRRPATPVPTLSPAEQAARDAREAAHSAAAESAARAKRELLDRARRLCAVLAPAMLSTYVVGLEEGSSGHSNGFVTVGFGVSKGQPCSFAGEALVEVRVEVDSRGRFTDVGRLLRGEIAELPAARLAVEPRAYSLDSRATLDDAAALGAALSQAAAFGRALLATLSV